MSKKSKVLKGIGIYSIGHATGAAFGKLLHDFIAYAYPIKEFSKYPWFNPQQYTNLYLQYSCGLENTFMWVFGITFGGLALASYLGHLAYKKLYSNWQF